MSGDVQPRKRKDKRRKQRDSLDRKSEGELLFSRQSSVQEDDESSHGVHITKMGTDDVHLHVHHEHGTGGHWCAKIFFFTLLAVLVGLISLIIMENRGISDLDTPLSESRFSNYFDGWVDEQRESHDEHDAIQASLEEHDEHDEPFEEEEAVSEGDEEEEEEDGEEEDDGDDDDEGEGEDHDEEEDDDVEEQITKEEYDEITQEDKDKTIENDNDDGDEEDDDNASLDGGENETFENEDENDEDNEDAEKDDDDDNEDAEKDDDDDDENGKKSIDEEETVSTEFIDQTGELHSVRGDLEDTDDDEDDNEDEAVDADTKENNKNSADPFDEDDDDDDDDDGTFELFDKVVDNDAEELLILQKKAEAQAAKNPENEQPASEENDETEAAEDKPSWLSSLAVKFGVGLALALVARLVLLRKNPNTNDEGPTEAMMKRRLTMAGPEDTFPEDVDTPMLPTDELSDDEEIIEEEIIEFLEEEVEEEVEEEEEEEIEIDEDGVEVEMSGKYVPETFEQLNALYRAHEEPSPHPTAKHQPHLIHTPETPETPSSMSSKEMPTKNLNENQHSLTNQVQQKPPPIFIAPPPPPPAAAAPLPKEISEPMTTNRNISNVELQKTNVTNSSPSPIRKRTVTHDVDYQPVAEDSQYDNEHDDSDEMDEEDEVDDDDDDDEDIDDDEDVSDIDEISDVDDTELMNRLEAKYGKLPPSSAEKEYKSDEDPDDPTWTQIKPKESVDGGGAQAFDEEQDSFEAQLHRAQAELARENFAAAFRAFNKLVNEHPDQPQSFYEQCRALNSYIQERKIEEYKNDALYACKRYLAFGEDIKDPDQYRLIAEITLNIIEDLGVLHQAIDIFENLLSFFPSDLNYMKRYAEILIQTGKLYDAKNLLSKILVSSPNDGLALAHYGLVLLQLAQNQPGAIRYLQRGIDTNEESTHKAFFYLKLGEAYQRQDKHVEALKVYERAVDLHLFPSIMQRAIYYVPNLRAQPFWSVDETTYGQFLNSMCSHWRIIREEGLQALKMERFFKNESENLRESGTWQMWELWAQGKRNDQNCQQAPFTCALIAEIPAVRNCRRGQVKFSVMLPKTHVWPHCGPTNARLRAHLGLVVPEDTEIRVGNEKRSWTEGEFLIFDDSFEHEVWQNGDGYRLVLIVDMWHPDLSEEQRQLLTPL